MIGQSISIGRKTRLNVKSSNIFLHVVLLLGVVISLLPFYW